MTSVLKGVFGKFHSSRKEKSDTEIKPKMTSRKMKTLSPQSVSTAAPSDISELPSFRPSARTSVTIRDVNGFPLSTDYYTPVKHLGKSADGTVFLVKNPNGEKFVLKFALICDDRGQRFLTTGDVTPEEIDAENHYQNKEYAERRKAAMIWHEAEVVQDILSGVDDSVEGFRYIANVPSCNKDTAKDDGLFYNCQQYAGRMRLNTYMSEIGVDKKFAYSFLHQGLHAVRLLQAKGYAHFDLKFDNFVVGYDQGETVCKMIDFGGCTKFGKRQRVPTTGGYMPPELYYRLQRSSVTIDPKYDVYSIGIIFMLLLCSESVSKWNRTEKPVTDRNLDQFVRVQKRSNSELRILQGLLRHDPAQRWSVEKAIQFLPKLKEKN